MSLFLELKVVAQSGKSHLIIDKSGLLKCYVKAAPEKGKANKEVIQVVAKVLHLSKKAIEIVAGLSSRKKLLKIDTQMSYKAILELLGSGTQQKIF